MNARQLRAIALGLAVLLALWGASELLSHGSDKTTGTLRFPPLSSAAVDSVSITHGADTVQLAKGATGAWTVNAFPASSTAVADLFTAFADSTPELAAESPSSFARMGVDSPAGRLVRVHGGGKTLVQVFVGGRGPNFDAAYVRVPGDTRVYLWPGSLTTVAERGVDDWREKRIAGVPPESIAVIEIERGRKAYQLRKQGTTWALGPASKPAPADSTTVARYVEQFRRVTAAGFASAHQVDSLRSTRPVRRVTLRGASGHELLALALDTAATGFWAHRAGDPIVYRLEFWQADQLTPTEQALAKKK